MTFRKFYNFLEIKVFLMIFLCLIPAKRIFTITHLSIFSLICSSYPPTCKPYWLKAELEAIEPNIPVFQYSNIPIVSEASNLGDTR